MKIRRESDPDWDLVEYEREPDWQGMAEELRENAIQREDRIYKKALDRRIDAPFKARRVRQEEAD